METTEQGRKAHNKRLREAKELASEKATVARLEAVEPPSFWELSEEEEITMSENGGKQLWSAFSERVSAQKGEIIFGSIMGSRRYNLAVQGSDLDLVAVYLPDLDTAIGIKADLQTFKQHDCKRPDFSVSSLEHFCSLLLRGDAKSVELLFTHHSNVLAESNDWAALCVLNLRFITKPVILNYIGELKGLKGVKKLIKLIEDAADPKDIHKCAYILYRIASLGIRFSQRSIDPIWFKPGDEDYETLMSIRKGVFDSHTLLTMVEKRLELLHEIFATSDLPAEVDSALIEEVKAWYLHLRQKRTSTSLSAVQSSTQFGSLIPGHELCLYREYANNAFFGVYAMHLPLKLWALVEPRPQDASIKFTLPNGDGTSNTYTFYELDRLIEAFERSEVATIMLIGDTEQRTYALASWAQLMPLLPSVWTNTLVYTACGYISGRFKSCRGDVSSEKVGFSSLEVSKRVGFATSLLSTGLEKLSNSEVAGTEANEGLKVLLEKLQNISRISDTLCTQTSDDQSIQELKDISNTFSKDFIALRPDFGRLFKSEIDFVALKGWFGQSRCSNEST